MDLKEEIAAAYLRSEVALAEQVNALVPATEMDAETIAALNPWVEFCAATGTRHAPSQPTTVAAYILQQASQGIPGDRIVGMVAAIERLHDYYGFANPVATSAARFVLGQVTKVEPPRSWTKGEQLSFAALPVEIQAVLQRRTKDQEKSMRRAQNEAAELRHKLTAAESNAVINGKENTMGKKPGEGPYHNNDGLVILRRETDPGANASKDISRKVDSNHAKNDGFSGPLKSDQ